MDDHTQKPESFWKEKLSPERYRVLREGGTEPAFTGELLDNKGAGLYVCGACGQELFSSNTKYESGSGWPSFWQAVDESKVLLVRDGSHGIERTEVRCTRCGSHLGHVFDDGPRETTGKRYCINSLSLDFHPQE